MPPRAFHRSFVILVSLFLLQCGSTPEAQKEEQSAPAQPVIPEPVQLQLETKSDTVASHSSGDETMTTDQKGERQIRFMVQIGAFKDPHNASRIQTTARDRYRMPVLNDYHTQLDLYQIRIGFFETYDRANTFRLKLRRDFPVDYADTWIVQLKR